MSPPKHHSPHTSHLASLNKYSLFSPKSSPWAEISWASNGWNPSRRQETVDTLRKWHSFSLSFWNCRLARSWSAEISSVKHLTDGKKFLAILSDIQTKVLTWGVWFYSGGGGETSDRTDRIQDCPPLLGNISHLQCDSLVIPSATIVNNILNSCKKPQRMTVWDWCSVDHDWQDLNVTVWLQQYPQSDIFKRLLWLKQGRALAGLSICWI